jgi:hypothetical protein
MNRPGARRGHTRAHTRQGKQCCPQRTRPAVTYVLASKGKDHNEYTQKLKRVDVMTTYPVIDFVGVEGTRDARDTFHV